MLDARRQALIVKQVPRTVLDDINDAEAKLAAVLAQVEIFREHIVQLKLTLPEPEVAEVVADE